MRITHLYVTDFDNNVNASDAPRFVSLTLDCLSPVSPYTQYPLNWIQYISAIHSCKVVLKSNT